MISEKVLFLALIEIAKARGKKCDRCWHYEVDIGQNKEHPSLCRRCVNIVNH